ncbi:MAG TPA: lamin tail domain-containing protein, partial [Pyrinomonadaceae bacterium]|nr:lamin tail domain-containing protein [Pyrinomonadaceae bacterium]
IVFASKDDPLTSNQDGNSELFLFHDGVLTQITHTDSETDRVANGNFQPTISDNGRYIAFCSNRDLTSQNSDHNFEVFVFDTHNSSFTQLTNTLNVPGASAAKISGNGNTIAFLRDTIATRELVLVPRLDAEVFQVKAQNTTSLLLAYGRVISDDGLRIVYSAETEPNSSQLFLWDGRNNVTRQLTALGSLEDEVPLQGTISGDGLRVAFATRRTVIGGNTDHSVELYVLDIPSGQIEQITDAPGSANSEVVSSLNDDGSLVTFSFPRVLAGPVSSSSLANNPEVFLASTTNRPSFGILSLSNGASHAGEQTDSAFIAGASIAIAQGTALSYTTREAQRLHDKTFLFNVAGTSVSVNGRSAQVLFVSPTQVNFVVPTATEVGPAEVIVTNADGFRSRTNVSISRAAPGLFTTNGQGFGAGVILNADTLQAGPFDPSSGMLRLSLFATGLRNALNVSVSVAGRALTLESVNASPELPGLDELHVLVPAAFRGVGAIDVTVKADERESNPVEVVFTGSAVRNIVINEVLADPPDGLAGDANHDGVRNSSEDEFLELFNAGTATNMTGWTIRTRSLGGTNETVRHTFTSGTILLADEVIVLFGGGDFDPSNPAFGCIRVHKTSTAGLSLVNSGLTVVVRDAAGDLVTEFTYGGSTGLEGDENQSLTRSPDVIGAFAQHTAAAGASGRRFSPGLRTNGTPFVQCAGQLHAITLSASATTLNVGETMNVVAQPLDNFGRSLPNINVSFRSDNPAVATVDAVSIDETSGTFNATITGHAAGTAHILAEARDGGITVTAALTITVMSPATSPLLVINQVYGGGNNSGATFQNDFVELFNRGTTTVDFSATPYSLQYASATGSFSNANKLNLSSGSIAPGQYFLVRLAGGTNNGVPLPTADASSSAINLSASDGKIALVVGTTVLSGSGCPLIESVADFVGYGSANCAEGVVVGSLNATKSARRLSSCIDTNVNNADFVVITNPPPPQNSQAPPVPCP